MKSNTRGFCGAVLFLTFIIGCPSTALAHNFSVTPLFAIPIGTFSKNTSALTMGIDAQYNFPVSPQLNVSTMFGFWAYGKQSIPVTDVDPNASSNLEFQFDNNIIHIGVGGSYRWDRTDWEPYVLVSGGIMQLYTEVSTRDKSSVDRLKIVGSKFVQASTAPYCEVGVGAIIPLRQMPMSRSGRVGFSANLDMQLSYFISGALDYYAISSIRVNNGTTEITQFRSPINLTVMRIGMNLAF